MSVDRYTVFVLKKDAIVRRIVDLIKKDISGFYDIVGEREVTIDRDTVLRLRKNDWETKWNPPPSEEQKEYCIEHEVGEAVVLLASIRAGIGAIELGRKLRGLHPIPHFCDSFSIRGRYADKSIQDRLVIDACGVGYLHDGNGKRLGYIPNIIHTVDDEKELHEHLKEFFKD